MSSPKLINVVRKGRPAILDSSSKSLLDLLHLQYLEFSVGLGQAENVFSNVAAGSSCLELARL